MPEKSEARDISQKLNVFCLAIAESNKMLWQLQVVTSKEKGNSRKKEMWLTKLDFFLMILSKIQFPLKLLNLLRARLKLYCKAVIPPHHFGQNCWHQSSYRISSCKCKCIRISASTVLSVFKKLNTLTDLCQQVCVTDHCQGTSALSDVKTTEFKPFKLGVSKVQTFP